MAFLSFRIRFPFSISRFLFSHHTPSYHWKKVPKTCLLVKKRNEPIATQWTERIASLLKEKYQITCYVEPKALEDVPTLKSVCELSPNECEVPPNDLIAISWQPKVDLIVTIGGDGTLLYLSSLFPGDSPPMINFYCGSLGFLMPFDLIQHAEVIHACLNGYQPVLMRQRVEYLVCSASSWPAPLSSPSSVWLPLLNDVVVKRQHRLTGIANVDCFVGNEHLARIQGDGLIVSSPTGSSAYSMAANGSIVHPGIDALLLTPLNSMTLASRPLILPGSSIIRLHVRSDSVVLEGKYGRVVENGEMVVIRRAQYPLTCFTRDDPTTDWIRDLKHRLLYQRQINEFRVENKTDSRLGKF